MKNMREVYRIDDIMRKLDVANFYPLDVLVVGGTGAGKSSTLNAMFQKDVAKVGRGCDPETMNVSSVSLNKYMRFWDSPGLGDDVQKDKNYSKELVDVLYRDYFIDGEQYGLIDNVLVILDGSGRDMGTTYRLLNDVIAPNIQAKRIIVAINQADMAMKGRHWDYVKNRPDEVLLQFLNDKSDSVQKRLREAIGVNVTRPVYYSAEKDYNVDRLLDAIIDGIPKTRRKFVA